MLTKLIVGAGIALGLASFTVAGASAAPLAVSSYSMANGGTGAYNYQDFSYTPCPGGDCIITGAPLSGGVGKLTDGVSPTGNWYAYGDATPWVGWYSGYPGGADPTVTFNFAGSQNIDSVTVWVDNSLGAGGVSLPDSVVIDGVSHSIAPDYGDGAPRGYTFSGLGLSGSSVDIQFNQGATPWIMVGEVSFDGNGAVPEPATWAMMLMGIGGLGMALRSRRQAAATA